MSLSIAAWRTKGKWRLWVLVAAPNDLVRHKRPQLNGFIFLERWLMPHGAGHNFVKKQVTAPYNLF